MTPDRYLVIAAGADPTATDDLAATLRDAATVRTAYDDAALADSLDEEVDVVLVDPGPAGVSLERLSTELRERGLVCQVGALAADPAPATDSPAVDAHVSRDDGEIRDAVDRLGTRARYRKRLDEYYALAAERAEHSDGAAGAAAARERERLDRHLERLRRDLEEAYRRLDTESVFEVALSRTPDDR